MGRREREGRVETEVAWKVTADDVQERGYNLDIKNPHVVADEHDDPDAILGQLDVAESEVRNAIDRLSGILAKALAP